ncbi:3'-5' exonuclease [Bacillus atrophaeus]|uniref:3'-5' exonuclease n=1 Tax=Bacillus atrophaeus TaxID=1452 RepID=UPI003D3362C0
MRIVSIDFETANSSRNSACSLGMTIFENNSIVMNHEWLIQPKQNRFHSFNTALHGIDENMVANEPRFDELWPEIKPYLTNGLVIAHNASFDISVLRSTLDDYGLDYPEFEYTCTLQMAKRHWKELESYKLSFLADRINFRFNHHNAREDSKAAMLIFLHIQEQYKALHFTDLLNHLDIKKGTLYAGGYTPSRLIKPKSKTRKPSKQNS